jgi:hypothetical protein
MKGALGIRTRRISAKNLLEAQLTKGTKPEKINGKTTSNIIPLSEGDKKRISREIENIDKPKSKKK